MGRGSAKRCQHAKRAYCRFLIDNKYHDANDEILDNCNPPEWDGDKELEDAWAQVNKIFDTFFIDNEKEFSYIGWKDEATRKRLEDAIDKAVRITTRKNNGRYKLVNDIEIYEVPED